MANYRTRYDVSASGYSSEILNFLDPTTNIITTYTITATNCVTTTENSGSSNCSTPEFKGSKTVDNQQTMYWKQKCETDDGPEISTYYWAGSTPVRTVIISQVYRGNITTQIDYVSYTPTTPDPSVFAIPSNCQQSP
eukprot:TRINITY_DN3865_c0_g1_i2.p1 TRINITY_DN3865_c0_g1~~TRINITY_DN3865_c0_g1_i2.p1  ORF type:complete len:137 (-),score=27.69 TRINITY_DN3865_c0_g1_i2:212-622(-)